MAAAINLVFERLHAHLKNFLSTCDNAKLSCDVADTLNRTLNNHLSFTIKDGKCQQLHDVLNAVIATMNYSEEVNQFDLFFIIENIEKHFDIEPLKNITIYS